MRLFGSNKNKKEQSGFVKISGNYLIFKGREASSPLLHDDKVDLAQPEEVYFVIDEYGAKSLHLSDLIHYHIQFPLKDLTEFINSYQNGMDSIRTYFIKICT